MFGTSIIQPAEPVRRTRNCGRKVRTGCVTCKTRHVKCDEQKPRCQRCVSTGRQCDGYVPIPPKQLRIKQEASPKTQFHRLLPNGEDEYESFPDEGLLYVVEPAFRQNEDFMLFPPSEYENASNPSLQYYNTNAAYHNSGLDNQSSSSRSCSSSSSPYPPSLELLDSSNQFDRMRLQASTQYLSPHNAYGTPSTERDSSALPLGPTSLPQAENWWGNSWNRGGWDGV